MSFNLVILATGPSGESDQPTHGKDWPNKLKKLIPDIKVNVCDSIDSAMEPIEEADAVFGYVIPKLFKRAKKLRWISCPQAGPPAGYYYPELINSSVIVTNVRGVFSDHIGAHIMSFVLAFSRGHHYYLRQQIQSNWSPGHKTIYLPEATALIVGVGSIGTEAARLCSAFGMTVLGVDPRVNESPPRVSKLYRPDELGQILPKGDFVIVTVPETPESQGLFGAKQFQQMKPGAYFINVGRGATVLLDDLTIALQTGEIAGAGLDVFEEEPLPSNNPLWTTPGVLITPHVATAGPYLDERRTEIFLDNCIRFNESRTLKNVVEKDQWF